jgi:hypothetical protein
MKLAVRWRLLMIVGLLLAVVGICPTQQAYATVTPRFPAHHGITPAGDSQTGWFINYYTGVDGMQATFSTLSDVNLSRGTPARDVDLYNTLQVPGESCLEMTAGASNYAGFSQTYHFFGFFNGCSVPISWASNVPMDTTWKNKYEQTVTYPSPVNYVTVSDKVVLAQILRTSVTPNCWKGQLYNKNTSAWDTIVQNICGTNDLNFTQGWALRETYGFNTPSSTNMCSPLGTKHVVTLKDQKYHYNNIPAPGYVPVTTFDQGLANSPTTCDNSGVWLWGQNNGLPIGGDSMITCDDLVIYCDH